MLHLTATSVPISFCCHSFVWSYIKVGQSSSILHLLLLCLIESLNLPFQILQNLINQLFGDSHLMGVGSSASLQRMTSSPSSPQQTGATPSSLQMSSLSSALFFNHCEHPDSGTPEAILLLHTLWTRRNWCLPDKSRRRISAAG